MDTVVLAVVWMHSIWLSTPISTTGHVWHGHQFRIYLNVYTFCYQIHIKFLVVVLVESTASLLFVSISADCRCLNGIRWSRIRWWNICISYLCRRQSLHRETMSTDHHNVHASMRERRPVSGHLSKIVTWIIFQSDHTDKKKSSTSWDRMNRHSLH